MRKKVLKGRVLVMLRRSYKPAAQIMCMKWNVKWLFIAIGLALFAGLIIQTGPANLAASLVKVNVPIFLASPGLTIAILLVMTLRFRSVLKGVWMETKKEPMPGFWSLFKAFSISNVFSMLSPAKSGEFMKSYFLKREGLDYGRGIIVVVIERVVDFVATSLLLIAFALLSASAFAYGYIIYGLALLALIGAGVLFFRSGLFMRMLAKIPLLSRSLKDAGTGACKAALRGGLTPRRMAWPLAITALGIVMIAARMYFIFLALGLQPDFFTVILVYMLVIVVGILSMIPGGFGSIEVSGTILYSVAFGYGPVTVATAMVLLRFSTFVIDVPAGVLCSYLAPKAPGTR